MPTVLMNGENLTEPHTFFEALFSRLELSGDLQNLSTMRDTLYRHLENSPRFQAGLLLLVDDAQATAIRVYEEMRQLLDRTEIPGQGVRIVLVGDMSLEEKLTLERLNSFSKRIVVRAFLEKFNRSETEAFLRMELKEAGDAKGIFSQEVCREIYRFADGTPRLTNQLADCLLVFGLETALNVKKSKDEAWDADPLPIDAGDNGILDNSDDVESAKKKEKEKEATSSRSLFQIDFTPAMVQRAWNKMQNFPDENNADDEVASSDAVKLPGATGGSVSNVMFGSLEDDDSDSGVHTIDFSSTISSPEEATGTWAYDDLYDELQEIRDTVDELNAIPEEWESSITTKAVNNSVSSNGTLGKKSEKVEQEAPISDDLFDPRRVAPNFHFPKSGEPLGGAWQSSHYTTGRAEGSRNSSFSSSGLCSVENSVSENISGGYSSKTITFSDVDSCNLSESTRKRNMTVDDVIYDAIMEDTVHSMKLLQRVLNALREENLQRTRVPQPADYWLNMQGQIKDSMRMIAASRVSQTEELRKDEELVNRIRATLASRNEVRETITAAPKTSAKQNHRDFYRPESLLEEEMLRYDSYSDAPGSRFSLENSVSSLHEADSADVSASETSTASTTPSTLTEGGTEVALLRTLLQDENVRNSINQEKLSQIISQLRTMSQTS